MVPTSLSASSSASTGTGDRMFGPVTFGGSGVPVWVWAGLAAAALIAAAIYLRGAR